jgi:polyhydroxyalkanoate synthesis repressor PhaR
LSEQRAGSEGPVIIKKYANRRLYNTQSSSYVTLDHLAQMVREGTDFEVRDARTGDDITRSVLAQIIFDEENKGQHLLPIQFLRQLIRFYGDSLQAFLPSYLEMSMNSFTKNQEDMREKFSQMFGTRFGIPEMGVKEFENLTRQNLQMFERAMRMFSPFGGVGAGMGAGMASGGRPEAPVEKSPPPRASSEREEEIRELKDQIAAMREQIAELADKK